MFNTLERALLQKLIRDNFQDAISQIKAGKGEELMSKWLPTILTIVSGAITAVTPNIQALMGNHPAITSVLVTVLSVILHWMPSPAAAPVAAPAAPPAS